MSEKSPVDLPTVALKCPNCDNSDKDEIFVCAPVWIRASDRSIPDSIHGQGIDPISDVDGDAIVECQKRDDSEEDAPICRYRGTLADFALYAQNVDVTPALDPALTGSSTPQPTRDEATE